MFLRRMVCMILAGGIALASPLPQERLRARAQAYYIAWQKKDVDAVWLFLSPRIRKHEGSEAYKEDMGLFFKGTTLLNFYFKDISLDPEDGRLGMVEAALEVEVQTEGGKRRFSVIQKERWIFDKDEQWYLEDPPKTVALSCGTVSASDEKPSNGIARCEQNHLEMITVRRF